MKLRKEVKEFAECMEKILRDNDYKGGWTKGQCRIDDLKAKLWEEIGEYYLSGTKDAEELVDIANVCMMIHSRRCKQKKIF